MPANLPFFSLITICHGREQHLANLLRGVTSSKLQPAEIIIVEPCPSECLATFSDLPIKSVKLQLSDDGSFNIAVARNLGASSAKHELMVFLDVDCIPEPAFLRRLVRHPAAEFALLMGDPHYLREPLPDDWEIACLCNLSVAHPVRPKIKFGSIRTEDYGLFWSLCFLASKSTFERIGGFDGSYTGYGAEDTDFAFTARKLEIPLFLVPAVAHHQQHTVYTPPVNHFEDIVGNSRRFYLKWNEWPMDNWLAAFTDMNLIEWSSSSDVITVINYPGEELMQQCRRFSAPYG